MANCLTTKQLMHSNNKPAAEENNDFLSKIKKMLIHKMDFNTTLYTTKNTHSSSINDWQIWPRVINLSMDHRTISYFLAHYFVLIVNI